MIAKFRDEFEAHIEQARLSAGLGGAAASDAALAAQGALEEHPGGRLAPTGAGDQAPGEHAGGPGTQKGGA
jgi:hypothetical protein